MRPEQAHRKLFQAEMKGHCDRVRDAIDYGVIHVVCDDARFHDCRAVQALLARQPRANRTPVSADVCSANQPMERIWWHLHETITRNKRCRSIGELLKEVYEWAATQSNIYRQSASLRTSYKLAA